MTAFYTLIACWSAHLLSLPLAAAFVGCTRHARPSSFSRHRIVWSSQADQGNLEIRELQSVEILGLSKEYWLDLRDTAVLPFEAFEFLERNLCHSTVHKKGDWSIFQLVDKVLLSEEGFYRAISTEKNSPTVPLLYSAAYGTALVASDNYMKQSFVVGSTLPCQYGDVVDPLLALEAAAGSNWLLIDADISDEPEALDWLDQQVSSLSRFLSSVTPTTKTMDTSSLIIPTDSSVASRTVDSAGGIAISCSSRAACLRVSTVLDQSMGELHVLDTTETDSGILIPTGIPEARIGRGSLRTAIALPFDVMLWESVKELKALPS